MSSGRTSTRQAAAKANEALLQNSRAGSRKRTSGGKRKGSKFEIPKSKRGRENTQESQSADTTRPFENGKKKSNRQLKDEPRAELQQEGKEPIHDETQKAKAITKGENHNAEEPVSESDVSKSKPKAALNRDL